MNFSNSGDRLLPENIRNDRFASEKSLGRRRLTGEKNPGSGVWYVRYRVNGKLVRKQLGKKHEAATY